MFKGENFIGVLLVGLCLVAAGVMIWASATGHELTYNGPSWLIWILAALFLGGSVWGLLQGVAAAATAVAVSNGPIHRLGNGRCSTGCAARVTIRHRSQAVTGPPTRSVRMS